MTDATNTDNGQAFDRWFDSFLDDYLKRRPVSATFIGAHQYDHELPDFSSEADADLVASAQDLIATLDAISSDGLTEAQTHDRALVRGFLEIQIGRLARPFSRRGTHRITRARRPSASFRCFSAMPNRRRTGSKRQSSE